MSTTTLSRKDQIEQTATALFKSRGYAATSMRDLATALGLEAAIKSHLTVLTKQPAASAVFQNEWKHLSEPFLTDFLKLRNDYENHFREIIKEGNTSGEFTVADEKMATLMLLSSLNFVHTWYKPEGNLTPEQISETLSNMLLNGIVSGQKSHKDLKQSIHQN